MEASALRHPGAVLGGPSPLLRLQSDERLVALTRRGNQAAYEALVGRYQARLLAFCRHMLSSREDAEDVLQEVFAAAFNALLGDERPINVRPWLYRIARNRSLNHLRRTQAIGVDSMDVHFADGGRTTADEVHRREDFRALVADVQELPETQRTALLLREIDALSYEQIAEAMETTVPSVKSLLVRARVSLAEMAEARQLTCEQVREELGEVAEGLRRSSAPVRRHVRGCERCATFRKQLRETNKALASVLPVAPLLFFKKFVLAHLGTTASAAGGATAAAAGGGAIGAGLSTAVSKTAASLAAAAIVGVGAVEVKRAQVPTRYGDATPAVVAPPAAIAAVPARRALPAPPVAEPLPEVTTARATYAPERRPAKEERAAAAAEEPRTPAARAASDPATPLPAAPAAPVAPTTTTTAPAVTPAPAATLPTGPVQEGSETVALPSPPAPPAPPAAVVTAPPAPPAPPAPAPPVTAPAQPPVATTPAPPAAPAGDPAVAPAPAPPAP